jgi:hypothetical protein
VLVNKYYFIKQWNNLVFRFYNLIQWLNFFTRFISHSKQLGKHSALISKRNDDSCFIVLGGKSASNFDFDSIIGKDVFVVNHFYHTDLHALLKPKYYVAIDESFFENFSEFFKKIKARSIRDCAFIFPLRFLSEDVAQDPQVFPIWDGVRVVDHKIPLNPQGMFPKFGTVALTTIGLAVSYGYKKIHLIGYDLPPGFLPHFYKESSKEIELKKTGGRLRTGEYEYCELFWQYTNCQHENYKIAKLAKLQGIEIINMGTKGYVKSFDFVGDIE